MGAIGLYRESFIAPMGRSYESVGRGYAPDVRDES